MNKSKLSKVARMLMFEVDDEVLNNLAIEYDALQTKINSLKKIDVMNVKPLIYVDETPLTLLSPDKSGHCLDQSKILNNAPHVIGDYIAIPRVIKNA